MSNRAIQLRTSKRRYRTKKVNGTPRKALCRGHRGSDHGKTIVVLWMNIKKVHPTQALVSQEARRLEAGIPLES